MHFSGGSASRAQISNPVPFDAGAFKSSGALRGAGSSLHPKIAPAILSASLLICRKNYGIRKEPSARIARLVPLLCYCVYTKKKRAETLSYLPPFIAGFCLSIVPPIAICISDAKKFVFIPPDFYGFPVSPVSMSCTVRSNCTRNKCLFICFQFQFLQ